MKFGFLIIAAIFFSFKGFSQKAIENYELDRKTLVAKIGENDKIDFLLDKSVLLRTINQFNSAINGFDSVNILSATHEHENLKYYYLELKSKNSNKTFVKWLIKRNNKLYYEDSAKGKFSDLNAFVICEGNDLCFPRLFFDDGKYFWGCRETLGCATKEESIKNPCMKTSGIFTE